MVKEREEKGGLISEEYSRRGTRLEIQDSFQSLKARKSNGGGIFEGWLKCPRAIFSLTLASRVANSGFYFHLFHPRRKPTQTKSTAAARFNGYANKEQRGIRQSVNNTYKYVTHL